MSYITTQEAKNSIKMGKASGEDIVDSEMLKYMLRKGTKWLYKLVIKAWELNAIVMEQKCVQKDNGQHVYYNTAN